MVYKLKANARLPIPAQVAGESLEAIRQSHGGALTPTIVVDEATSEASPLHKCFEWDDQKAATAHRLNQARYLLRAVVVTYGEGEDEEAKTVRAFVTVKEDEREVYSEIHEVMQNPEYRMQVLARAKAELRQWAKRYENLTEFSDLISLVRGWDEAA